MEAPLVLLFLFGSVGAVDVIYDHLYRYRLYAHASSLTEHLSHTLGILGLILTLTMLVFMEMGRLGFTLFLGVQAFLVIITLWDVSMEHASRAPLGGLSTHEYLLHTVIFLLHGAFLWAVIANAADLIHGAGVGTLRWPPLAPLLLFNAMAFLVFGLGMFFLHVYLLGVGYRTLKKVPATPTAPLVQPPGGSRAPGV